MRLIYILILFSIVCLPANPVLAQKGDEPESFGVFETRQQYHDFMGQAKGLAYGDNGSAELQAMIPMLNDVVLQRPIGSIAGQHKSTGALMDLLSNKSIREDIEMVDHQYEDLKELNNEIQSKVANRVRELDFSDPDKLQGQLLAIRKMASDNLNSVLVAHQLTRLRQIAAQAQLRRRSFAEILTSQPLKEELEISDSQKDLLLEQEEEIEAELREQIAELRLKAREKLISNLEPAQQTQAKELLGEEFDFSSLSRGEKQDRKKAWKK